MSKVMMALDSMLFVLFLFVYRVFSSINGPGEITKTAVLDKEARFMWNTTDGAGIDEAKWGLIEGSTVVPFFITVNKFDGEKKSDALKTNTSKAFRYQNRVHFIGNITVGQAWFVITNISTKDTKEYAASIKESGKTFELFRVKLTVLPAPTTVPPTTTATNTTSRGSNSSTTPTSSTSIGSTITTKGPSETKGLSGGAIAGISVAVILVVVGGVALVIYIVKKSKNNGSNGSNNKSGPLEMDKPSGDGNPTSPEA